MAGGGIQPGHDVSARRTNSATTPSEDNIVTVHDFHATMLPPTRHRTTKRLTYRFQGRDFRLTDVAGEVVKKMLA